MRAVFRCDASPEIGSGHIFRCVTLANGLRDKGWACHFVVSQETIDTLPFLANIGHEITVIFQSDEARIINDIGADLVVFDHYFRDAELERQVNATVKMVIDDVADRVHDCDILIDTTYGRDGEDYRDLVPSACEIFTGAQYALLKPEFAVKRGEAKKRRTHTRTVRKILVSLGSTNIHNCTTGVLKFLHSFDEKALDINVVIGSKAPHLNDVQAQVDGINAKGFHRAKLLMDVDTMPDLMVEADLSIGAGGTTSWERCCLGLPTLLVNIADNQNLISEQLHKAGAVYDLGKYQKITEEHFHRALSSFVNSPETLQTMSEKAFDITDGRGVEKVIRIIEDRLK